MLHGLKQYGCSVRGLDNNFKSLDKSLERQDIRRRQDTEDKDKLLIENDFTAFGFFNSGEISFKFVFLNKQIVEMGEQYQY